VLICGVAGESIGFLWDRTTLNRLIEIFADRGARVLDVMTVPADALEIRNEGGIVH